MPREQSPAFQFYPQDFVSDPKVLAMTSAARGAYIMILCHCWTNGSVPDDDVVLRRISAYDGRDWRQTIASLRACLSHKEGRLYSPRLERERQKQADYREMKRNAGLASAQQRANRASTDPPTESNPPSLSLSSSSSSSLIAGSQQQANLGARDHSTSSNGASRAHQKTPIIGKNIHLNHVLCDDSQSYCVPASVHHKLAGRLAPRHAGDHDRAAEALLAWYPTVWAKLVAGFVMGDAFKFWQAQFDIAFASDVPQKTQRLAPDPETFIAETIASMRKDGTIS